MPLVAGLGIPPITVDLILICISSVPIAGIAAVKRASARQFLVAYREFVGLACADHELSVTAGAHLASDGALEKAMPQAIDHDLFE